MTDTPTPHSMFTPEQFERAAKASTETVASAPRIPSSGSACQDWWKENAAMLTQAASQARVLDLVRAFAKGYHGYVWAEELRQLVEWREDRT